MLAGIALGCRALLAVLFGAAFIGKISSKAALSGFTDSLTALPWLRQRRRPALAIATLVAEGAATVALVVPGATLPGFGLAVVLLTLFTAIPAATLSRGIELSCRCFGVRSAKIGPSHVVRNGIALCAAAAGLTASQASGVIAAWRPIPIGAGILAGIMFVGWDEIAYLIRPPVQAPSHSWRTRP